MVDVWIPYGKTETCVRIPPRNFLGTIKSNIDVKTDFKNEIRIALNNPLNSKRLSEIINLNDKIAIFVDDVSFITPNQLLIQYILDYLYSLEVKRENISLIFGFELTQIANYEEILRLLGEDITNKVNILFHDYKDQNLTHVGTTSKHGNEIYLNRFFADADIKIIIGEIGFHSFAGYKGGGQKLLHGITGEETIKRNYTLMLNSKAKIGVLDENPVREDISEAAEFIGVDFAFYVINNNKGTPLKILAGDLKHVFVEGVKLVDKFYKVTVENRADIVIICPGGYPSDSTLSQSLKSLESAVQVVKRGGVIILIAECSKGYGDKIFYDWMSKFNNLKDIEKSIKRHFVLGGEYAYFLTRTMQKAKIILVSVMPDYYSTNVFNLQTARTVNEALNEAFNISGKNSKVWVIPDANNILPKIYTKEQ